METHTNRLFAQQRRGFGTAGPTPCLAPLERTRAYVDAHAPMRDDRGMYRMATMDSVLAGDITLGEYFKLSPNVDEDRGLTRERIMHGFIAALRRNPSIADSCRAVGITRQTIWAWRRDDPDFDATVQSTLDMALADYDEALTHGLYRRALLELEPQRTGVPVTAYFVMKARDPRFRDNYAAPATTTARSSLRFMTDTERDDTVVGEYRVSPAALPEPGPEP